MFVFYWWYNYSRLRSPDSTPTPPRGSTASNLLEEARRKENSSSAVVSLQTRKEQSPAAIGIEVNTTSGRHNKYQVQYGGIPLANKTKLLNLQ